MNQSDYKTFTDAWTTASEVMPGGKVLSTQAMQLVIDALKEYPLQHLLAAIKKHVQTGRFAPTPADIIEIIASHTGAKHLGAEESWGIALQSFDEFATVVWTKEIAEARNIAADIYSQGDKVGARMAFKEAYNRLLATADPRAVWTINAGFDGEHRAMIINQAIAAGRLPRGSGEHYLLGVDAPTITAAALIEHAKENTGGISPAAAIGAIKTILDESTDIKEMEFQTRRAKRLEFEAHRQAEVAKVECKLQGELH
jgi:hypothetical protein